ncbi:Protein of unknown function [Bacillus wiedmannii]|nr:Protein of unknown function [Bacillus wiedmannii]
MSASEIRNTNKDNFEIQKWRENEYVLSHKIELHNGNRH